MQTRRALRATQGHEAHVGRASACAGLQSRSAACPSSSEIAWLCGPPDRIKTASGRNAGDLVAGAFGGRVSSNARPSSTEVPIALRATQCNEADVGQALACSRLQAALRAGGRPPSSTEVPMALRATQGYGDAVAGVIKSMVCPPSSTERYFHPQTAGVTHAP